MNHIFAITLLSLTAQASAGFLKSQEFQTLQTDGRESQPQQKHSYPQDCGMKSHLHITLQHVSMLQQDNVPGAGIDDMHDAQLDGQFVLKNGDLHVTLSMQVKTYEKQLAHVSRKVVLEKSLSNGATVDELRVLIRRSVPAWKEQEDITFVFEDGTSGKKQDRLGTHKTATITSNAKFAPFVKVWKDGFSQVNCVKDYMFYHGDKYGDHKDTYMLGSRARVSIVHYDDFVAMKDRESMTPKICFDFCRTVPNMAFFGITTAAKVNQCYCMPYFEAMAGDSSLCDSPCEGNQGPGCGGASKSSIYTMRTCDDTLSDLARLSGNAADLRNELHRTIGTLENYIALIDGAAADMIPLFGHVGDSVASGLAQYARDFGRFATETLALGKKLEKNLDFLSQELGDHQAKLKEDVQDNKMVKRAESLLKETEEVSTRGETTLSKLEEMVKTVHPEIQFRSEFKAMDAYRPVMYFVDNTLDGMNSLHRNVTKLGDEVPVPTTCEGEKVGAPIIDMNLEDCAQACDQALVHGCKGFQHFDNVGYGSGKTRRQLCFLFSSFSGHTGHYYTGCKEGKHGLETNLRTGCWTKFSKFAGGKFDGSGTLKPDPRARSHPQFCKDCFGKFTKYDRCYTALSE